MPHAWTDARTLRHAVIGTIAVVLALAATCTKATASRVYVTELRGAVGVAAVRQIERAIATAHAGGGVALVIRLDTPGGLVSATREIIKQILGSPLPIVVHVAPSGARAASAGTFIVYAAHVAAMAPGTNLGAATPIELGGLPGQPSPRPGERPSGEKETPREPGGAASRKAINDVGAFLRSLAQLRGRNAEWADKAVRDAATLTADEALRENVIDLIAVDTAELIRRIDGRRVALGGTTRTLATGDAARIDIAPDWRTRLLAAVSDPNVAFLLLLIGFYGIVLEFWNPGVFFPGVIGGICLILALVALSMLPVHYGALALLVIGIALMVGEAFTPGIGALGIGGLAAFVVGAAFLFEGADADIPFAVSWPLIAGSAATSAVLLAGVGGAALSARRRTPATGDAAMIGGPAVVVDWSGGAGRVRAQGEIWSARADAPLRPNDTVRIVARDGLTLIVAP